MSDIKGERGETSFSRHTAGEVALVFFQISLRGNTTYADSGGAKTNVWCWKSENTHLVVRTRNYTVCIREKHQYSL